MRTFQSLRGRSKQFSICKSLAIWHCFVCSSATFLSIYPSTLNFFFLEIWFIRGKNGLTLQIVIMWVCHWHLLFYTTIGNEYENSPDVCSVGIIVIREGWRIKKLRVCRGFLREGHAIPQSIFPVALVTQWRRQKRSKKREMKVILKCHVIIYLKGLIIPDSFPMHCNSVGPYNCLVFRQILQVISVSTVLHFSVSYWKL